MDIDRVQRWVMSTLTLTVAFVWTIGMVLGALFTIDQGREGTQILIFALATTINLAAVIGVRLINELGWMTPWLLTAFAPSGLGVWALLTR